MKKIILCSLIVFSTLAHVFAQQKKDFTAKTKSNEKERTAILNSYRTILKKELKQDIIFAVNKLNVASNYAWLQSDVQRKDGAAIKTGQNQDVDCCHVEALLQKKNGIWYVLEHGEFSTDVWWEGICARHKAPCVIFE